MLNRWLKFGCLSAGLIFAFAAGVSAQENLLAHRSWQFHDPDWDYLQKAIPEAKAAGMNRIQLSHRIIMDAEQLWQGKEQEVEWRLSVVRHAIELAHELDLEVDMWTHELSGLPRDRFRDDEGRVVLSDELWQWLDAKYEKLFKLVPGLDGLVLTFAETDHKVYTDRVISDLPKPMRIAKLIEVLAEVCARHGKTLLVRTFVYQPNEIGFLHTALTAIAKTEAKTHNIMVMTKCVPHDWTPYYPFNPLLGDVAGLPQVVEIDLGQEFTGQSQILHCEVDYIKYVLDYCRAKGVIGAVARVERFGNHVLGTPNEVNLHAFGRLLADRDVSADALWQEWTVERYGEKAAVHVIRALRRTFEVTNLTFFPLEQWITNHSRIPDWGYAYGHITSRQNAKWIPSPRQLQLRDELLRPTCDTLLKIAREKDLARELADKSLADLARARPHLSDEDYRQLWHFLSLGRDNVDVFAEHQLAMFAALAYEHAKSSDLFTDDEAKRFRQRALDHAAALRQWADRMAHRYGDGIWPGLPDRCRGFAHEVEKRVNR